MEICLDLQKNPGGTLHNNLEYVIWMISYQD